MPRGGFAAPLNPVRDARRQVWTDRSPRKGRPEGATAVTLWDVTNYRMDVTVTGSRALEIRGNLERIYPDVLTAEVIVALEALAPLDVDRRAVMAGRIARRAARASGRQPIAFLDPKATIPRTS